MNLNDVIPMLPHEYQSACARLYNDNREIFDKCPGSSHNHQAWTGGYVGHILETAMIAHLTYEALSQVRPLGFELSDAILGLFLHDLEKPWKYAGLVDLRSNEDRFNFVLSKLNEYGIVLREEHWNAIKYAHGEGDDYSGYRRTQLPLAAFVHCCDTISARIWFDFPPV